MRALFAGGERRAAAGRWVRWATWVAAAAAAQALTIGGGCRSLPHPPTPCELRAPAPDDALSATQRIPAEIWGELLVPDHRDRSLPLTELATCDGAPLAVTTLQGQSQVLPARPELAPVYAALGEEVALWIPLRHYDDGDALGPVAILRRHEAAPEPHLEVLAIGTLRAPAAASLIREELADGSLLLLATGERCPTGGACVREVQLLPLVGQGFHDAPLRSGLEERPARLVLSERASVAADRSSRRDFELHRTLQDGGDGLRIIEHLRVLRCPRIGDGSCEVESTSRRERALSFDGERLLAPASLWPPPGVASTPAAEGSG